VRISAHFRTFISAASFPLRDSKRTYDFAGMETAESPPDASPENIKPSSSTTTNLRWLDDLERDFDKSFVECDILLGDIDSDQVSFFRIINLL
jgi:hypothetical protein